MALSILLALVPACEPGQDAVDGVTSAAKPAPSEGGTAGLPEESPSVGLSHAELDLAFDAARTRFAESPPSLHGMYEYRSEGGTLRYELWVDWPAFRVSLTVGDSGTAPTDETDPFIVATRDGKRFGVRDPLAEETYVTRSLGEAPWIIGPMVNFFGDPDPCASTSVVGIDDVLGRSAIRARCTKFDRYQVWIDAETGLELRREVPDQGSLEPGWSGFVELEFVSDFDQALFEPASV